MPPGGQTHGRLIPATQAVGTSVGQMTTHLYRFRHRLRTSRRKKFLAFFLNSDDGIAKLCS